MKKKFNKLKIFSSLWKYIKEDKYKFIFGCFLIFIIELSNILTGYLNGRAIEEITNNNLKLSIIYLGIYFVIIFFGKGILLEKSNGIIYKLENKISMGLCYDAYVKAINLPSYAFEKLSSGEIINRINNDSDTLSFSIKHLLNIFIHFFGSFLVLIYIFINSWIIGLEILLFLFILYYNFKKYNSLMIDNHKKRKNEQDKFTSLTNESLRGIREVKTLGVKNNLYNESKNIINKVFDISNIEMSLEIKITIINKLIKSILEVLVLISCIILLYYSKVSLTFVIANTYYIYNFMYLIDDVNQFMHIYQKLYVSLNRIDEIINNKLFDDEKFGNIELKECYGDIKFNNVTFHYPNESNLLNNFNINIEPNKKIALVGASGQGKSTIFNLITRIFDSTSGSISIDDIDIKDLTEKSLRKEISIIRQEPFVFNRTILENFKIIDEDIELNTIRKYCKMAYLDDYIMSLPNKYDTLLGECGVNLSGGQKQRLAIARTLAKKSKIILFDEATSALDNSSQEYIKKTINNLVKEHTILIVAHRLSTIIDSDVIYVIEKGKVCGSGTHEELLKSNTIYKNLYNKESLNS